MRKNKISILNLFILWLGVNALYPEFLFAQKADTTGNSRKNWLWCSGGTTYATGMAFLYQVWYKGYDHTSFHWFNDYTEWEQMDKAGHAFSSFQIANAYSSSLKWAHYEPKKAALYGSLASFVTVSSIEIFDGFSSKWGASYSDLIANASGTLLYFSQAYFIDKTPVRMKFSFHYTSYAQMRPDALGKNKMEQIVKDYNGQTYWLSINPHLLGWQQCPSWISIALGYGASGMISGNNKDALPLYDAICIPWQSPYRRYYLSIDFNPSKLKIKNKILKAVLKTFNVIKLPFPALELQQEKVYVKGLYF